MYITCIYHTVLLLALPFITVLSQIFYISEYFKSMICLLSFWLFFSWRITFQFSLISNVHAIITLWVFFLLTNVLTFQFLSYQYYFTRTKNYYLILHVHFFSWWQSGHIPVSILLILHAHDILTFFLRSFSCWHMSSQSSFFPPLTSLHRKSFFLRRHLQRTDTFFSHIPMLGHSPEWHTAPHGWPQGIYNHSIG